MPSWKAGTKLVKSYNVYFFIVFVLTKHGRRKDKKSKEEALRNTRQVKQWNLELLEQRKVKAKDNLPSRKIFRAVDFL